MPQVVLVDTCVFLNVLDVPGFNQERDEILEMMDQFIEDTSVNLLLPYAAIVETGNHIAHLSDGRERRTYARKFVDQVSAAIAGNAPWTPTQVIDLRTFNLWLENYPDMAMTGVGLGDLCMIKEWEAACLRHPIHRVRIWSIDGHLIGYDRSP